MIYHVLVEISELKNFIDYIKNSKEKYQIFEFRDSFFSPYFDIDIESISCFFHEDKNDIYEYCVNILNKFFD